MNIKPPGTAQQIGHQPELHTFIGDTPQRTEPSDLELREASFSAIRAYADTMSDRRASSLLVEESLLDIRTAPASLQARWVRTSH